MSRARDDGYVYLSDYRPPAWRVDRAELEFDLDSEVTDVRAKLQLFADPAQPRQALRLDGEGLELRALALNGRVLEATEYQLDAEGLTIPEVLDGCVLELRLRLYPARNTRLEGLYRSGELLLTQCEAEGFRRICYFIDRPDVLPAWRITLRGDRGRYPVLLANGNPVSQRELADGRHEAVWDNPHRTPCYLFALAAGRLERLSRSVTTLGERPVELNLWAAPEDIGRCEYALGAVERALRWDERRFGCVYDLDVFNVVAAQDFNMGAMENKGLNIFNARYLLADADTATDGDFLAVESVIAHEYLHNWSGNRVTLRDWFQLSLKEGLTVFRDQLFTGDLHSHGLKRIEDVRLLRSRQFAEDGGALAHPVRPPRYREINNFYTMTVYEKGAEILRMLYRLLGEDAFRAGLERYFAEHDGRAATVEDLLGALSQASGRDLSPYLAWYTQAGTPEVQLHEDFDPAGRRYALRASQRTAPTPEQADKRPLPIPLRYALYGEDGTVLREGIFELTESAQELVFDDMPTRPLPSFNQDFSAPVKLQLEYTPGQLARLVRNERDAFNRWEAVQRLATGLLLGRFHDADAAGLALQDAYARLLDRSRHDPALVAEMMALPDFDTLAELGEHIDVEALTGARERLLDRLALALQDRLASTYEALAATARGGLSADAMAARSLRNACLAWLSRIEPAGERAAAQFAQADNLNDRLAALRCLLHASAPSAASALASFQARYARDPLVTDKWIALVATRPRIEALDDLQALRASAWWLPGNPNRVRALLGNFARNNPVAFHRPDGAGYRELAEQIAGLDVANPQVAARLLGAFEGWRKLAGPRRERARDALLSLTGRLASRDARDLWQRMLA